MLNHLRCHHVMLCDATLGSGIERISMLDRGTIVVYFDHIRFNPFSSDLDGAILLSKKSDMTEAEKKKCAKTLFKEQGSSLR